MIKAKSNTTPIPASSPRNACISSLTSEIVVFLDLTSGTIAGPTRKPKIFPERLHTRLMQVANVLSSGGNQIAEIVGGADIVKVAEK